MTTFQITLGETYYNKGFFNIPVDYNKFITSRSDEITLVLGEQGSVKAKINRDANPSGNARIFGHKELKNWIQTNLRLNDTMDIIIESPEKLVLQPSLSQKAVATIVKSVLNRVRQVFPGWDSFQHPPFIDDEVDYKRKTVEKAKALLGKNELSRLLNDEAFDEVLGRIKKIGSDNNLLWRGVPKSGDLNILPAVESKKSTFCHVFFDLLYGEDKAEVRLGQYLDFIKQNNLPNKWTFPTYFLFILHPTQELFIKPSTIQNFLATIGQKARFSSKPKVSSYQSIKAVAELLRQELSDYQPRDMVDIQSLMWVVATQSDVIKEQIRYWKIAPGENAIYWDEWRDGKFIAIDWSEIGDIANMTRSEFDARCQQVLAKHSDWSKQGMTQVWKFAKDIKSGDRIIANRGFQQVLGIGTVTGDYEFVPDKKFGHQIPVVWDDIMRRSVNEPGWRRTLMAVTAEKFNEIIDLPPQHTNQLAQPFASLFRNWDEANWALDFLRDTLERMGINNPDDPRVALTLPVGKPKIRLNFGNWLVLGFEGKGIAGLTVPKNNLLKNAIHSEGFASKGLGERYYYYDKIQNDILRNMSSELQTLYEKSMQVIANRFNKWQASPYRKAHQPRLMEALFDTDLRKKILMEGIEQKDMPILSATGQYGYFSPETVELMTVLHHSPRKETYQAKQDDYKKFIEHPLQQLMKDVVAILPSEITDVMETEKRLFSRILKNDYGQGGAWAHYWGALYPKGGKRIEDSQLSMWVNHRWFEFGFYVGEYGSVNRQRLQENCREHHAVLEVLLTDTFGDTHFVAGRPDTLVFNPDGTLSDENATWQDWLRDPVTFGFDLSRILPFPEPFQHSQRALRDLVAQTYRKLFPLVLLAMEDDPLPAIKRYLKIDIDNEPASLNPPYPLETMADETGFPQTQLEQWTRAIARKKQVVFYGPPGTGKTFVAERLAKHLVSGSDGFTELVQFHPAYAYEDFMQGIRPLTQPDGTLSYKLMSGRFMGFCSRARERDGLCVLIIDEINRANLSRVFGELMYLLEYRGKSIPLAGGKTFHIPDNVRIIGTMNTADRSIALVDHALRRRFAFLLLQPNFDVLRQFHQQNGSNFPVDLLINQLQKLNQQINDTHYEIGISFFLRETLADEITDIWQMEIEPYLEEYFFDQPEKVGDFRWEKVRSALNL